MNLERVGSSETYQRHLQLMFENTAIGIAIAGPDTRLVRANPRFCELLGAAAEDLQERDLLELMHPDDLAEAKQSFSDLVERRASSSTGSLRFMHRQGHPLWAQFKFTPIIGQEGRIDGFSALIEDITERKLTENLLRDQREVLELMAKNLPLHETLARIVSLIEEQEPGCTSTIYLVKDGRLRIGAAPSFPESFLQTVDGCPVGPTSGSCGAAAHFGHRIVSTDIANETSPIWGEFRDWILSYGIRAAWSTPVLSKDGAVLGTVSMCWREPTSPSRRHLELVDVATRLMGIAIEREETERLLLEQQAKMVTSSKLAALGEMAAGLAHEINNPLAIIHIRAHQIIRMVEQDKIDPAAFLQISKTIQSTTERISAIIKGLRSFARETEPTERSRVAMKRLVEDTLTFCRERFKSHGIVLRLSDIPSNLELECCPTQISQVLLNLLNNSHDAIEQCGEKWIQIDAGSDPEHVWLSVTDSGTGIPEAIRDKIMQPFFTTKSVDRGTGPGLSISAGIIASHGGRLILDNSCPNTRFNVLLPAQKAAST